MVTGGAIRFTESGLHPFFFFGIFFMLDDAEYGKIVSKSAVAKRIIFRIFVVLAVALITVLAFRFFYTKSSAKVTVNNLYHFWTQKDYAAVFEQSEKILEKTPFKSSVLIYNAYSAFYLALSQTDILQAQNYLETSITAMRKAIYGAKHSDLQGIYYMLGRAYFYKNTLLSYHYYSDLVIKYLNYSENFADDMHEYLGLSYAMLNMRKESIISFTNALSARSSDVLHLAIAEQYYNNAQYEVAKQYLHRLNTECENDVLIQKSHYMLGQIYINEKNLENAASEFQIVLDKNPNSADAYYGIGIINRMQSNKAKARAAIRKALQLQPNHQLALQELAEMS
ncbi:MAG: hypothetical protein Ta2A_04630 [Treponemataceae bacterium]|nr:MAG: hypothetical protein Ta2A_04630 [Treponemataceae bacterium]